MTADEIEREFLELRNRVEKLEKLAANPLGAITVEEWQKRMQPPPEWISGGPW